MNYRAAGVAAILASLFIVGGASASTTFTDPLIVNGPGPHSIGTLPNSADLLTVGGEFTAAPGSAPHGVTVAPSLRPTVADNSNASNAAMIVSSGTIHTAVAGSHFVFMGAQFVPPNIINNGASFREGATVKITGPPIGGTVGNWPLHVLSGFPRLDQGLAVGGGSGPGTYGGVRIQGPYPQEQLMQTALALPDGLWRTAIDGSDNYVVERNTAAAGDFTTNARRLTLTAAGDLAVPGTLQFGAHVAAPIIATGYIIVRDAAGVQRRLLVGE